jgi:hypothetical protein
MTDTKIIEHNHESPVCPACSNRKTVGNLNGPWRIAFKFTVSLVLPSILALMVFLIPSVIKNNEARKVGKRYTPEMAVADQAALRNELTKESLECKRDLENKLDSLGDRFDKLADVLRDHIIAQGPGGPPKSGY